LVINIGPNKFDGHILPNWDLGRISPPQNPMSQYIEAMRFFEGVNNKK
jgi:hypothetical protein